MTSADIATSAEAIVIELEAPPTTLTPVLSGDYVERCVVSALHQPDALLVSAHPDHLAFEFGIRPGARFSDGSAVEPVHVLQTLIDSAASPLWSRFARYIETAEATDERLRLTMRRPAAFVPAMLRAVDFAPTHPDRRTGNGPYQRGAAFDSGRQRYHLSPNPYFADAKHRSDVIFAVRTDVHGVPERFFTGACNVTCGTAFPLDRLPEFHGSPLLHSAPSGIFMQIEPSTAGAEGSLKNPQVRVALLDCLDLSAVERAFNGGLTVAAHRVDAPAVRDVALPRRLRIGYHDFYPNDSVLQRLSRQWHEKLGIDIELVERDYTGGESGGLDASFVLRYAPFDHPYAAFDQWVATTADFEYDDLLQRSAADDADSRRSLEAILQERLPVIRLFEVVSHWFADPHITGFSWPSDAVFDFTGLRRVSGVPA